jgi:hypothetical protein
VVTGTHKQGTEHLAFEIIVIFKGGHFQTCNKET